MKYQKLGQKNQNKGHTLQGINNKYTLRGIE
jgi:hypothetical protein